MAARTRARSDRPGRSAEGAAARRRSARARRRAARRARAGRVLPWVLAAVLLVSSGVAGYIAWRDASTAVTDPLAPGQEQRAIGERVMDPAPSGRPGQPTGVAVSGDFVYAADPVAKAVLAFRRDGSRAATIGAGMLDTPVYVAVGPVDGRIYVSDRGSQRIVVFSATGARLRSFGPQGTGPAPQATARPWKPLGLGFASDGTLYVADVEGEQSIAVFSPTGVRTGTIGDGLPLGRSGRRLAFPNGIVPLRDRTVVADGNNGRLLYLDREGTLVKVVPVDGLLRGAAALPDGRLIVADASNHVLRVFDADGQEGVRAGGYGREPGRFAYPAGVAVDDHARIYVGDAGNSRVQVVRIPGVTKPIPGGMAAAWPRLVLAGILAVAGFVLVVYANARSRSSRRASARETGL